MEDQTSTKQIVFNGNGSSLFGIYILNGILTILTLGFYYPWAKAATLRYLYQETELENSPFMFHGTGKEMFMGYIKAVGIFLVLYGLVVWAVLSRNPTYLYISFGIFYLAIFVLIPLAIHSSMKYRMSRTSWRAIHFGYRGDMVTLLKKFALGLLLTVVTAGIYGAWFAINIRKYVIENIRFGNLKFHYDGTGSDYFMLLLKGYVLTVLTLGIYMFWFAKDMFNYFVDNTRIEQDDKVIYLQSTATGGGYFRLVMGNFLIVIFSLGLATPWAMVRTLNFVYTNVLIIGDLDLNAIEQTEKAYNDATGEDVADMLDIGMI